MRLPFLGSYTQTQGFGTNPQIYARFGLKGHNGLDYGLPCGTAVVAPISGRVSLGFDAGGYGNYVLITGGGLEAVLAHLSSVAVNQGVNVSEGQLIGRSGTTGFSSGCHLHWGVRPIPSNLNNGFRGYEDPTKYLTNQEGQVTPDQLKQVLDAITESTRQLAQFIGDDRREQLQNFQKSTEQLTVATKQLAQFIGDARREIAELKQIINK